MNEDFVIKKSIKDTVFCIKRPCEESIRLCCFYCSLSRECMEEDIICFYLSKRANNTYINSPVRKITDSEIECDYLRFLKEIAVEEL